MITYQDRRLSTLADEGRWAELLGIYRRARAAAAGRHGDRAAVGETAALGHVIAYDAPPELAARLFDGDGGAGSAAGIGDHDAGPLWEVLATRHSWRRLAPLLDPVPVRRLVAHTRALLGEDLSCGVEPDEEGVPAVLEPWEAAGWEESSRVREYLRTGGARRALLAIPATREGLGPVDLPVPGMGVPPAGGWGTVVGLAATRLLDGLAPWTTSVCVRGTAPEAAARLAPGRRVTGGHLPFPAAYPALVQAASSAPSHGTAQGRLAVWRLLAAMTGEPRVSVPEVNALVARLRCFAWCDPGDELRYLHLVLEDPATGLAWGISGAEPA